MPDISPRSTTQARSDEVQTVRALRLDSPACLRVSGADARSFLQGQLSADLRKLDADRAQWSSYNSPKGRLLAVPLLVADGDAIELWLPRALVEPVARRLRMFVLRSKVQIDAPAAGAAALGLVGPAAAAWLGERRLPAPEQTMQAVQTGAVRVLRTLGATPRFLVLASPQQLAELAPDAESAESGWRRADIEAGVPVVYPETQDRWVAQMANVDLIGGISFDKGCYTGQEIVARLHYLGNLKKRMFLVRGAGVAPAPGSAIHASGGDGQTVGEIVDACADGDGFIASAVLQLATANSDTLHLDPANPLSRPRAFAYPGAPDYSVR